MEQTTCQVSFNANYVAKCLSEGYPILYTGKDGCAAHEYAVNLHPLKVESGTTETDTTKRPTGYGFHAPTVSFPVVDTLMVESTESESKTKLDRFIAALKQIKQEVLKVERGEWPKDDDPLVNALYTAAGVTGGWAYPYSREETVFPLPFTRKRKFWSSVRRLDEVYDNRSLVRSCLPIDVYEE